MTTEPTFEHKYTRVFKRDLPVKLSDEEMQRNGKHLAEKTKLREQIQKKAKEIATQYAAEVKKVEGEISRLAEIGATGAELREVECGERYHGNVVEIVRFDRDQNHKDAVIEARALTTAEQQVGIPGLDPAQPGASDDEGEQSGDGDGDAPDDEDDGAAVLQFPGVRNNGPAQGAPGAMATSSTGGKVWVGGEEVDREEVEGKTADDETNEPEPTILTAPGGAPKYTEEPEERDEDESDERIVDASPATSERKAKPKKAAKPSKKPAPKKKK